MVVAAPTIDGHLVEAVARLDDGTKTIADINRAVGRAAEALGLPRPSYQQIRIIVHRARELGEAPSRRYPYEPSTAQLLLEVAYRVRPLDDLLDRAADVPVRKLR